MAAGSAHLFLIISFALSKNVGALLSLVPQDIEAAGYRLSPSPSTRVLQQAIPLQPSLSYPSFGAGRTTLWYY